jgi:hypothetical protein
MTTTDQRAVCCTTLNRIRAKGPCESGWRKLLAHVGKTKADDGLLPFAVIVESNGIDDALWCCRSVDYDRVWRLFAVWCARQVQHLMTDPRSIAALNVAQAYASGLAARDQLKAAELAARSAAWYAARSAAESARKDMFLRVVNAPSEEAAAQILLAAMPVKEAA